MGANINLIKPVNRFLEDLTINALLVKTKYVTELVLFQKVHLCNLFTSKVCILEPKESILVHYYYV